MSAITGGVENAGKNFGKNIYNKKKKKIKNKAGKFTDLIKSFKPQTP